MRCSGRRRSIGARQCSLGRIAMCLPTTLDRRMLALSISGSKDIGGRSPRLVASLRQSSDQRLPELADRRALHSGAPCREGVSAFAVFDTKTP